MHLKPSDLPIMPAALYSRSLKTYSGIFLLVFTGMFYVVSEAHAQSEIETDSLYTKNLLDKEKYIEIGSYVSPLKYHHDIPIPLGISMRYKSFQIITDFELVYSIFYNFYNRRWSPYIGYGRIDSSPAISLGLTFEVYKIYLHKPSKMILFLEPDVTWFGFQDPYFFPELRAGIKFDLYP